MTEPEDILLPLRLAAKEIGMTELQNRTGIPRTHFYKMLKGNPSLSHLCAVANALGFEFKIRQVSHPKGSDAAGSGLQGAGVRENLEG